MSLLFALLLIGLPAAALFYDFYKGGHNTAFVRPDAAPQRAISNGSE